MKSAIGKKLIVRVLFISLIAFLASGCQPEVLSWDEDVLLNTGEVVVAHWDVTYSNQGEAGNPLRVRMSPDRKKSIKFEYKGKQYHYHGDARLLLLAISPQGIPNFVLIPDDFGWDYKNKFDLCTTPYYAQLIPDSTGNSWSYPPNIEAWLYGLEGNLTSNFAYKNPIKNSKKTTSDIISEQHFAKYQSDLKHLTFVDKSHQNSYCRKAK